MLQKELLAPLTGDLQGPLEIVGCDARLRAFGFRACHLDRSLSQSLCAHIIGVATIGVTRSSTGPDRHQAFVP